jgi:hypothetical protein
MRRLTCPFNIDEKRGEADSGALPATLPAIAKSTQRQHRNPYRAGRRAQTAGTSGAPQAAFEFEGELRALLSSAY